MELLEKDPSGSLARERFLLRETCLVARLKIEETPDEEIIRQAEENNLFQFPTTKAARRIAQACLKRLSALDSAALMQLLATGTPEQQRQTNVYVMMCRYHLVRTFMLEEIGRRFQELDYSFTPLDMNAFFTRYGQVNPRAQHWSESTVKRIKTELMHILREGGYRENASSVSLRPPLLDYRVEQGIRANGNAAWLVAFNGMEV